MNTQHVHKTADGLAWHRHPHKASHPVDVERGHPLPDPQRDRLRLHDGRPPSLRVTCSPECAHEGGH